MAEEAAGGACAGSVEAAVARREGVAGSAESEPGQSSSRPPTRQPPWAKTGGSEEQNGAADERDRADLAAQTAGSATEETEQASLVDGQRSLAKKGSGKRPGKQPGSPGHGRIQKLVITARCEHRPEICAACAAALSADAVSRACTAWDEVDIAPPVEGLIGLTFSVTPHTLLEVSGSCGHVSRAQAWRAPADGQWEKVELGEWRLVGPRLAGVIVLLALRMRLSRASIRELLMELFELTLSTGVIDEGRDRRSDPGSGPGQSAAGGRPGGRPRAGRATACR